ncbi:MAG: hypothetical protein KBB84_03995 [Spirochaetes bacterium]|nr:hypothetical protein [Spirochaetota bacterium]
MENSSKTGCYVLYRKMEKNSGKIFNGYPEKTYNEDIYRYQWFIFEDYKVMAKVETSVSA